MTVLEGALGWMVVGQVICVAMIADKGLPELESGREYAGFIALITVFWPVSLCLWIVSIVDAFVTTLKGRRS